MNVVNESSPAPSLRRLPFLIRLAPQFVNRLSEAFPGHERNSSEISGLLFGLVETESSVIQNFRTFPQSGRNEEHGTKVGQQALFEALVSQSKTDPELAGLKLLGWFSARQTGGLTDEDIAFHKKNFNSYNDVALIISSERASELSLELYCRTGEGVFSGEGHRWASARIPTGSPTVSPLEVPMRAKIHDDFYMRAYQFDELGNEGESGLGWKDTLASKTKRAFELLKTVKPEDKGESAAPKPESKEPATDDLASLKSVSQALQFATRGGAAAAPARVRDERAQPRQTVPERTEDRRFDPEEPHIVSSRPIANPLENSATAREEKQPAPEATNVVHRELTPYSAGSSPVLGINRPPAPPVLALQVSSPQLPQVTRPTTTRSLPWLAMAAVFLVTAGATFGLIYLKGAHANGTLPGFLQVLWPSPGLTLRLSNSEDRIQLTWNRNIPIVRNAREAILEINDGPDHRQIRLTGSEVANGSILYLPNTDDVLFRLEVHGAAGQSASESMRVLSSPKQAIAASHQPGKRPEERAPASTVPNARISASQLQLGGEKRVDPARLVPFKPRNELTQNQDLHANNQVATEPGNLVPPPSAKSTINSPPEVNLPPTETATPQFAVSGAPPLTSVSFGREGSNIVAETAPATTAPGVRQTTPSSSTVSGGSVPAPQQQRVAERTSTPDTQRQDNLRQGDILNTAGAQAPIGDQAKPEQTSPAVSHPLVTYRPPRPVKQVLPRVSGVPAGTTGAIGEVKVLVKVNESGQVIEARLVDGNSKVGSTFKNAALAAAKQWVFEPASLHGRNIVSDHTILFQFRH